MLLLVPAYLGSPRQKAVKLLCVCVFLTETAHDDLPLGN